MAIAFGMHPTNTTLCSRFLGTVTPAELGQYMALLQNDPHLRDGMTHFVDCREAQQILGARSAATLEIVMGPLATRFAAVAIVASSSPAVQIARHVQELLHTSSDRCSVYATSEEAWQAL